MGQQSHYLIVPLLIKCEFCEQSPWAANSQQPPRFQIIFLFALKCAEFKKTSATNI